jgi:hypothetical protein
MMNKKADFGFSNLVLIILALIGGLLILAVFAYILGAFTDPNKVQEGIGCRIMIQSTARLEDATSGFITVKNFMNACKVIETTIPRQQNYAQYGGSVSRMTTEEFQNVVMYDFAEVINNAWWISGEGERADYILKHLAGLFIKENNCYIFYAVKIHSPNKRISQNFGAITKGMFLVALKNIKRSDLMGGTLKGDQRSIFSYVSLDNTGAGVVFKEIGKDDPVITLSQGGADAIYAVAVGFVKKSGVSKLLETIFKGSGMEVKQGTSFIYIAPYDEVAKICTVSN